jgi:1-deoxy-D-xylulose-5-phosphate synthase
MTIARVVIFSQYFDAPRGEKTMFKILGRIKSPADLKELSIDELKLLSQEIRRFLIQSVSKTGGHLASNLGVVELTVALHYVFDSPSDKIVWDVGHQAYVHKLLTGRRKDFKNLRQLGGMSGFPKRYESCHDVFETGHSSTSISAALGLAAARDLEGENGEVIAVIGDGALTGGMAFEALNDAGRGHTRVIVILNDNEMSIAKNVGGICKHLTRLRASKDYIKAKEEVEDVLHQVPIVGESLVQTIKRAKEGVKSLVVEKNIFEQMGITYLGPIDGHNYEELIYVLENTKELKGPLLIHVKTLKGKGYKKAEENPSLYHGVSRFNASEGVNLSDKQDNFSTALGQAMVKLGQEEPKLVGITAAMAEGTGLDLFAAFDKKRFFDVGIAEQHAVTFAAGLAASGYKPVVAVYSSFLQRAYDQMLHDVALQKLPVIFGADRSGLVGEDGNTHHGIFDIAYLTSIPGMTVLSPKSTREMEGALRYALSLNAPVTIRYPRGNTHIDAKYDHDFRQVGVQILHKGKRGVLLATGKSVEWALKIHEHLPNLGVAEAPQTWPLDDEGLLKLVKKYSYVFTLEDHVLTNGFGEHVAAMLMYHQKKTKVYSFGYQDGHIAHGKTDGLLEKEGLTPQQMAVKIQTLMEEH